MNMHSAGYMNSREYGIDEQVAEKPQIVKLVTLLICARPQEQTNLRVFFLRCAPTQIVFMTRKAKKKIKNEELRAYARQRCKVL